MVCYIYCSIAFAFILAMLFTMFYNNADEFEQILDDHQRDVYKKIKKQRMYLFLHGLIIGMACGILYLYIYKNQNQVQKTCTFVAIMFVCTYFYYILSPRDTILSHLNNSEQVNKWNQIRLKMKFRYHLGLLIGLIGGGLMCFGINKN